MDVCSTGWLERLLTRFLRLRMHILTKIKSILLESAIINPFNRTSYRVRSDLVQYSFTRSCCSKVVEYASEFHSKWSDLLRKLGCNGLCRSLAPSCWVTSMVITISCTIYLYLPKADEVVWVTNVRLADVKVVIALKWSCEMSCPTCGAIFSSTR